MIYTIPNSPWFLSVLGMHCEVMGRAACMCLTFLSHEWTNLMTTDMWQSLFSLSQTANMPEDYPDQFDEVVDFIQATIKRLRRSPDKQTPIFSRRERNRQNAAANVENSSKKGRRNQKGKNRGCVLTEIHLNVTDLDLGYETKEELIFRYCSGSCDAAETTYDKILKNLTRKKKLVTDKVKQACCRPTAFDDDLSFLDDNLVYHILKKHSAKRCGCVWWLHASSGASFAFLLWCKEWDQGSWGCICSEWRNEDQERRMRGRESRARAWGSIGGWRLLTFYGKVNKSSGGDADGWMACRLSFPFDTVHHQWDSDPWGMCLKTQPCHNTLCCSYTICARSLAVD